MEGLHARVTSLTEKGEWLEQTEETVHRLEQHTVETRAHLERRVNDVDAQKQMIEQALAEAMRVATILSALESRIAALPGGDQNLRDAEDTIGQLEQRAAETTAELERCVRHFHVEKQTIEQALALALTEADHRLAQADETVRRLEQHTVETTAHLERRVNDVDAQKRTIEQTMVEAMRVAAILNTLERRVAGLVGSDHALGQAETAIDQLERRANEAKVRLEQVVRVKVDVEHELASVEKQLQTLTESTRNSINVRCSTDVSRSRAWSVGRPLLRWATVPGALVAVVLLGVVVLRTRDRSSEIAGTAPTASWGAAGATPISLLPTQAMRLAMFDMPAGRAVATTGTIGVKAASSAHWPDLANATRTARTAGTSRAVGAAEQVVKYVGILAVESEPPGSVVFVDRQLVGNTPLQLRRLRAGSHVVRIERNGYDRWTTAVLVPADKQTRVSAKLQAARDR
jgi:hypothetical protein